MTTAGAFLFSNSIGSRKAKPRLLDAFARVAAGVFWLASGSIQEYNGKRLFQQAQLLCDDRIPAMIVAESMETVV
jgi:hypothetical protein